MEPGKWAQVSESKPRLFSSHNWIVRYINMHMLFYNMSICSSIKFLPYNVNVHVNVHMLNFELKYTIFSFLNYIWTEIQLQKLCKN